MKTREERKVAMVDRAPYALDFSEGAWFARWPSASGMPPSPAVWTATWLRPVGGGGAQHMAHPDTGDAFCGAPTAGVVEGSKLQKCNTCHHERNLLFRTEADARSAAGLLTYSWERARAEAPKES